MSWLSTQRITAVAVMGAAWLAAPAVEAQEPGQPDLVIQAFIIGAFDHPISPGDPLRMSVVVLNAGDAASAGTTLRYYRSDDATITAADTTVVTEAVDGLAAAATSTHEVERTALAGTYYYAACVDAVAGESDTTNNCSHAFEIEVAGPPPQTSPDLVVGAPAVSDDSPSAGASFTLSATVTNAGDGASAATRLRYYRSSDTTITTSDDEDGSHPVGALAAGATSDEAGGLTAPSTPGTYYYGACVDAVAGESDTENNCSEALTVMVEEPAPDLVVLGPNVSDSSPETGGTFRLIVTVQNVGERQAAATSMQYYRSTDATITTSDTEEGTEPVRALGVLQGSAKTISLTAPTTAGTYYYGGCVDAVPGESDTANNCSTSVQVDVSEPPPPPPPPTSPDLVVGAPSVSDTSLDAGDSFTLSTTVENAGDGDAAATTLRYYRSTDAAITNSDTEVGAGAVEGLSAGATSDQSVDLTAPAAGTYFYGACVDAVAGESDTTNNCSGSVQVTVSPPPPPPPSNPDLVVGAPSVSDTSLDAGDSFTLSTTVENAGDGASAATTLRYYRSTDTAITSSDTEVGTDAVEGLSTGTTSDQSVNLTAPSSGGTYYYGACVDAVAGESDTTNNCSGSVQVTVSPPPPPSNPDLVVGAPSVSDTSLDAGDSFTLSTTVENAGDGDAAATTLRYYRSTDAAITNSDTEVGAGAVEGSPPARPATSRWT